MENIEIILGTYENLLIGYKPTPSFANKSLTLETSFTDDSHRGALRCVSVSQSGVLASSSTDDSIRLHSLRKRKEIGGLFEHRGTVNSMVFYDKNHMFSASEDGTICLWQSRNWELMRTLKGHKAHVMAVAIHPSGKLGLSVGSDRSFLTWDLLTGKLAFQRKLTDVAQNIFFTPDGNFYVLVFNKKLEMCSVADTKAMREIPVDWRINAVCHVQDNTFAVGGDDRYVLLIDVQEDLQLLTLDAAKTGTAEFKSRVRCISTLECQGNRHLVVATANGDIKIFKLDLDKNISEEVLFGEANVRVTSMGVYNSLSEAGETAQKRMKSTKNTSHKCNTDEEEEDEDDASDSEDASERLSNMSHRPKKRKLDNDVAVMVKKKKKRKSAKEIHISQEGNDSEEKTAKKAKWETKSKKQKIKKNKKFIT